MSTTCTTPAGPAPAPARPCTELFAAAHADPAALGALLERFRGFLRARAPAAGPPGFRAPFGTAALVQDALLAACRHFPAFRGTTAAELATWLGTILRRVALTQARREARAGRPDGAGATADEGRREIRLQELPDPRLVPPDEAAVRQERAQTVRDALAALPADYRAALGLRFEDRLPFDEVGRRLGRSGESARKVVARALRDLGARLGRAG